MQNSKIYQNNNLYKKLINISIIFIIVKNNKFKKRKNNINKQK